MKSMLQHNQNASSVYRLYITISIAGLGASDLSTVVQYNHVRCAIN